VESDLHLLTVLRYVEANALRAGLVARAQDWEWTSLRYGLDDDAKPRGLLDPWPIQRPADWVDYVNEPLADNQLTRVRTSVVRGRPFGRADWVERLCRELGWSSRCTSAAANRDP
jgi:putative transposase